MDRFTHSAILLLLLTFLNQLSAFSYGSRELIWFNVVRVGYFVAYVLAVIRLFQIKEEFLGDIGPNAVLAFDERWEYVQDRLCLVTAFRPGAGHAVVNGIVNSNITDGYGLYCQIDLQCKSVFGDKKLDGLITHREDFKNIWGAFKERGVNTDTEEVLLLWSSTHYKDKSINFLANYLRQRVFMPKVFVLVCSKGTYDQVGMDYKWALGDKPQQVVRDLKAITWCVSEVMN